MGEIEPVDESEQGIYMSYQQTIYDDRGEYEVIVRGRVMGKLLTDCTFRVTFSDGLSISGVGHNIEDAILNARLAIDNHWSIIDAIQRASRRR